MLIKLVYMYVCYDGFFKLFLTVYFIMFLAWWWYKSIKIYCKINNIAGPIYGYWIQLTQDFCHKHFYTFTCYNDSFKIINLTLIRPTKERSQRIWLVIGESWMCIDFQLISLSKSVLVSPRISSICSMNFERIFWSTF